jgi:hypothetical protein
MTELLEGQRLAVDMAVDMAADMPRSPRPAVAGLSTHLDPSETREWRRVAGTPIGSGFAGGD